MFFLALLNSSESEALEKVYKNHCKEFINIAYNILKDVYEAQDVVQVSFEKLVKCRKSIDLTDTERVRGFLYTVVRNQAIDVYKRKKKIVYIEPSDLNNMEIKEDTEIDNNLLVLERRKEFAVLLDRINPRYSTILTLKYYLELENTEIAQTLDCSEVNVRVLLHRARQSLKEVLLKEVN